MFTVISAAVDSLAPADFQGLYLGSFILDLTLIEGLVKSFGGK